MPSWMSLGFQDSSSFYMLELSLLYDYVMVVMSGVIVLILYILCFLFFSVKFYKNLSESTLVEMIWSIVPAFLLIMLVLPSMKVLYLLEDVKDPLLTFKVVAHQWYWTYVVPLFKNFYYKFNGENLFFYEYDSFMEEKEYPRLLCCSNVLFLPVKVSSRFLVTSVDVIHSFTVPSLGFKVDALPGRINQVFLNPLRVGEFFGQCSEICGSNHSFMPIHVKVVSESFYDMMSKKYLLNLIEEV